MAVASLNELEGHLLIARDVDVIAPQRHSETQRDVDVARRMLISLTRTLQHRIALDELARITAQSSSG